MAKGNCNAYLHISYLLRYYFLLTKTGELFPLKLCCVGTRAGNFHLLGANLENYSLDFPTEAKYFTLRGH